MKNALVGIVSRLNTAIERLSEAEHMLIEMSQIKKQREKDEKNGTEYPRTMGQLQNV